MLQRPMQFVTRSEGGVLHDSDKKCGKAAFLYMLHSTVVISCYSARIASHAGKREGRERPPKNRGGHVTLSSGTLLRTSTRPHGGRSRPHLSLREGSETAPQERR